MEDYPRENMEVVKQDKKHILLTNKDPNLSHLFDNAGPHTPNSVGGEGLNQSSMEVDSGYPDDSAEQDSYALFDGHGDSYMPDLSPDSSQLVLESGNGETYNHGNKLDKGKASSDPSKAHWIEGRQLLNARNSPKPHHAGTIAQNKATAVKNPAAAFRVNSPWNGQGDSRNRPLPKLEIVDATKVKGTPPQLTSPPADHYNMQLLALSAQQQQERLQEEQQQQRRQGESYRQGSSSDALQQLARKAKLRQEEVAATRNPEKACYPKPLPPTAQPSLVRTGSPARLAQVQSRKLPLNVNVSASVGGWSVTGQTAPPDHVNIQPKVLPTNNVPYPTQGSPIVSMHARGVPIGKRHDANVKKSTFTIPVTKVTAPQEPELKSPLDHPEHQLDHQQRARFFSGDASTTQSTQGALDDEAPLNERDKEAALALRELLEQSEKAPEGSAKAVFEDLVKAHRSSPALIGSGLPARLLHEQLIMHNTPPPTYDQAYNSPQSMHHLLRPANPNSEASTLLPPHVMMSHDPRNSPMNTVKVEKPPSPLPAQGYVPSSVALPGQGVVFPFPAGAVGSQGFVIYPVAGQHPVSLPRHPSPALPYVGDHQYPVASSTAMANNVYLTPTATPPTIDIASTRSQTPAKVAASRDRKSSSGSNSSRRNSDGSLTCGLCGHSFRSTPALNGHMRVHSSSDKKSKDERSHKSHDSAPKHTPPSSIPMSHNPEAVFRDVGRSPPGLLAVGGAPPGMEAMPPLLAQPYGTASLNQQLATRGHNGLLTMASAASYLKTEPTHSSEFVYQPTAIAPTYVVPPSMVIQPAHMMGNFGVNAPDQLLKNKINPQSIHYSQLYTTPTQAPFSLNLPNMIHPSLLPPQDLQYVNNQEGAMQLEVNPQPTYTPEQTATENKQMAFNNISDENYPSNYELHLSGTNSLSQLASIAVAAANRDQLPGEIVGGHTADYQHPYHPQPEPSNPNNPGSELGVVWEATSAPNTHPQSNPMYQNADSKTSPIRTGHDPFILPVTTAQRRLQSRYGEYDAQTINQNSSFAPEPTVTWHDDSMLLSSYDDPIMREAVNVANPSKILPNSMMGGTPSCGSLFSSSSDRPFRQRHHSEGSHLIKTSNSSILKQILHSPVPTVKLRPGTSEGNHHVNNSSMPNEESNLQSAMVHENQPVNPGPIQGKHQVKNEVPATQEVWAEPKPVQRRVRRRRHSADCRLLKAGSQPNKHDFMRQGLVGNNPMKKPNNTILRVRHKPPPLVIPSSVNAYTNHNQPYYYQSHLHHRRRPSGDSNSSYNGVVDNKIPPYTPPPMISPMRAGSGLYCTTPNTPSAKLFRQLSNNDSQSFPTIPELDENFEDEDQELIRSSDPKINIGSRFQADIPDIRPQKFAMRDKHKAELIWYCPPQDGAIEQLSKSKMEEFMELSCSAVVPYGGSNKEFALDCLARSGGDILSAVRRIVSRKNPLSAPATTQHFLGSGRTWTSVEVKQFECGMLQHRKDFCVISKMVKTRSTADCVERYYHVSKRHRRRVQRPKRFHGDERGDVMTLLAGSPADVRRAMKIEPSGTSSSEEDDSSQQAHFTAPPSRQWTNHLPQTNSPHLGHISLPNQPQSHPQLGRPPTQQYAQKLVKTHKARVQQASGIGSPSPAGSPASITSTDDQPAQIFTCPVCGKSFAKVKSRNAHMKTHGKQAQEKRRQREEEAARRREQSSNRQPLGPPQQFALPPRPNFIAPQQVPGNQQMLHGLIANPHQNVRITM